MYNLIELQGFQKDANFKVENIFQNFSGGLEGENIKNIDFNILIYGKPCMLQWMRVSFAKQFRISSVQLDQVF